MGLCGFDIAGFDEKIDSSYFDVIPLRQTGDRLNPFIINFL